MRVWQAAAVVTGGILWGEFWIWLRDHATPRRHANEAHSDELHSFLDDADWPDNRGDQT
jgi:hypothetical protein